MKKFWKFVKRNRVIIALSLIILICLIVCVVFGFKLFWGSTEGDKYGTRTDGLPENPITEEYKKAIDAHFLANKYVDSVNYSVHGPIIYITIDFKSELAIKTAKTLANDSLKVIDKSILEKYELQFVLTASSVENSKIYPTMGYKGIKRNSISWINS